MQASNQKPVLLLLLVLLLAGGACGRVVIFEAGSRGSRQHSSSSHHRTYIVMEQREDGALLETLLTVDTWTGPTSSFSMQAALHQLLRPVTWMYQQLEAIDALQQATVNTFLMRHNEALEELAHEPLEGLAHPQEDMEEQLHRLGCQRFSAAMDEYMQGLVASSTSAALHMQSITEIVERSNSLYALGAEPQHGAESLALQADLATNVAHRDEAVPSSTHSDYEWEALEVLTDAYDDDLVEEWQPQQHNLQAEEKNPGPLLRGASQWWSQQDSEQHSEQDTAGLLWQPISMALQRHSDEGSDDAFEPFIDLGAAAASQHLQQHSTFSSTLRAHSHSHSKEQQQPKQPIAKEVQAFEQAFAEDGSDVHSFEQLPPLSLGSDWEVLLMLSLAASAVAVAFVVSWMQLQKAMQRSRHLSVPVMVEHEGRLVWGVVMVLDEEVADNKVACRDMNVVEVPQGLLKG